MGRPTEYSDEIISKVEAYLDTCQDETIQEITGESEKFTSYKNKLKVNLPTIEGLAVYLKIHRDTIYQWEKEHEAFSDIIGELRHRQAQSLINNGLSGDYNPTIAKVLLSKHGYKEEVKTEQQHTGEVTFKGMNVIKPNEPGT